DVQVADVSGGDMLAINFASLSFNDASAATPVPEPAACAALLGAVALGFVALRRHAACA
ncbi:MAG: PEP-CTERM sorting domain-containing protein, partial [Proteobacteria bacterium]|nr:PEP-CTERM sorting domain-containing protein [Pseudomonadota bacterium]